MPLSSDFSLKEKWILLNWSAGIVVSLVAIILLFIGANSKMDRTHELALKQIDKNTVGLQTNLDSCQRIIAEIENNGVDIP